MTVHDVQEVKKIEKRLGRLEKKYEKNPKALIRKARIEKTAKSLIKRINVLTRRY